MVAELRRQGRAIRRERKAYDEAMALLYKRIGSAEAFGIARAAAADAARLRREGLHRRVSSRPTPQVATPRGIHLRDGVLYPRDLSAADAAAARRYLAGIRRAREVVDRRSDAVLRARRQLVAAIRAGQEAGINFQQIADITGLPRHTPRHLVIYESDM